jgi:UDP-GlcNAc:undecaprenyl-phosphate GlcNAc-1-phosphate transferase
MGDCGSLFLGFFLAGLSLAEAPVAGARKDVLAVVLLPVLLLLIPIADTTLVTVSRRYHGRRVSQGGRDHTSHRLVALGMSERSATLTIWLLAIVAGAVAVVVNHTSTMVAILLVATFALGLLFLMIFLGRVKVYEPVASEQEGKGRALIPTLADFTYKRRLFETLNDVVLIILCYYAAFLLRFEDDSTRALLFGPFLRSLPLILVVQLSVFLAMGLYKGVWRYTGMEDLIRIVQAVAVAVGLSTVGIVFLSRFEGFSRAVVVIDGVLLLLTVCGSRVSFRILRSWFFRRAPAQGRRVLIYGAGDAGELLVREIENNPALALVPVGFVDDDPQKEGRMIHGVRVLGSFAEFPRIAEASQPEEVVVSSRNIGADRLGELERACRDGGIAFRRLKIAIE